jgi:hypothetical protein
MSGAAGNFEKDGIRLSPCPKATFEQMRSHMLDQTSNSRVTGSKGGDLKINAKPQSDPRSFSCEAWKHLQK